MWTINFQMFKLVLEKAEEPEIKLPTSAGSSKKQESSRKTSISALLTMPKPLTMWITTNCGKEWDKNLRNFNRSSSQVTQEDYLQSLRLTGVNTLKRRYKGCAKQHSRGRSLYSWEKNTKKQTQKFKGNLSHSNSSAKTVWFAMIPMYIGWSPKSLSANH